jgi:hypothetical protein
MATENVPRPAAAAETLPESDFEFVVTIRLYGVGDATDAASVMQAYTGRFVLANGDQAEIIDVAPLPADAEISVPVPDEGKAQAAMAKQAASSGQASSGAG